jgi:tetratricopeptide (TPR) repeat protein
VYEIGALVLLAVFVIIVAIIAPESFLHEVTPLIKQVFSVALILSLVAVGIDVVRLVAVFRTRARELDLERQRLANERNRLALETLRVLLNTVREPVSDSELSQHKEEAQAEAREGKRLRDEISPPQLSEAAEHFAKAYNLDKTLWKAGVAAAILWINENAFERARGLLEEVCASAKLDSEQRWAAELNLGVLWNRRYLTYRSREDAERALKCIEDANATLGHGKVARADARALTLKNLAAFNVALGRWKEGIRLLRQYRGEKLSRKLLEGIFDPDELRTILYMDPELKDLLGPDDNEQEDGEGGNQK